MTQYTTDTGYYVLCDADGRVIAKANVPAGTHTVADAVDPTASYDVETADKLHDVTIDSEYQ